MVKDLDDVVIRTVSRILVPFHADLQPLRVCSRGTAAPEAVSRGGCIMGGELHPPRRGV